MFFHIRELVATSGAATLSNTGTGFTRPPWKAEKTEQNTGPPSPAITLFRKTGGGMAVVFFKREPLSLVKGP